MPFYVLDGFTVGVCSGVEVGVVQGGATRMLLEVLLLCIASTTKSFLFENVTNSILTITFFIYVQDYFSAIFSHARYQFSIKTKLVSQRCPYLNLNLYKFTNKYIEIFHIFCSRGPKIQSIGGSGRLSHPRQMISCCPTTRLASFRSTGTRAR
jgi:hypothetical protein